MTQVFFLGENPATSRASGTLLPQTLANGLKLAMIIAITSVGLSLIFGTTGLSNFAHGEMVTFGALMAWWFNSDFGLHIIPAAILAIAVSALFGILFETGLWRPLRNRKTSLTSMMIVSIGIALAAALRLPVLLRRRSQGLPAVHRCSPTPSTSARSTSRRDRCSSWASRILVIVGVALFLLKARFGKAIRAVSDNPDLASSSGIDTNRVILVVWAIGGALAGLGGVLYGLEFGVKWDMGFTLLLLMFAAITLGGLGNPFGALVGSLVIGFFVELWTWIVPNANDLKTVGALVALILVLLVRPQGLLGSKERIG